MIEPGWVYNSSCEKSEINKQKPITVTAKFHILIRFNKIT